MLVVSACARGGLGEPTPTPEPLPGSIVVVMIGDGMGNAQTEAASDYAYGQPGQLYMQQLPVELSVHTASLSGTTDSAAAATAMATGQLTYNGKIGLDRREDPAQTIIEWAKARGMRTAVVSTASLPHATPGAFTAHEVSRNDMLAIADDQALEVQPDVMLGGGAAYYRPSGAGSYRSDGGLLGPLEQAGYEIVTTADELSATLDPEAPAKVIGLFADDHMPYVMDRPANSVVPTLADMSVAALELVGRDSAGAIVVIEGARIDMAGHLNDLDRNVTETIDFDEAIEAVDRWLAETERAEDATASLVVTADHECGGLEVLSANGQGVMPDVTWRWGNHTNASITLRGRGPAAELLESEAANGPIDHRWIHAVATSVLGGSAFVRPERILAPDGNMHDLRYLAAEQDNVTGFGEGFNELDALWIDADEYGLGLGIEGVFEWGANAIVIGIDLDFGAGTGFDRFEGSFSDTTGVADAILSGSSLDTPGVSGFGADVAVVSFGGEDPRAEDALDTAGLRGLHGVYGDPADFGWFSISTNYGQNVRAADVAIEAATGEGYEVFIPWAVLYPGEGGGVPVNAQIALFGVLVNDDGGFTSNQALPPFPAGTDNPGRDLTAVPGLVHFELDSDGDGTADGAVAPTVLTP